MGHLNPDTPVATKNSAEYGVFNGTIKKWWSRAIGMIFDYVRDTFKQGHFHVFKKLVK